MKEWYIKDKVTSILDRMGNKQSSKRLEADRAAARVANLCSQEFDKASHMYNLHSMAEFQRHMVKFIHVTIRDELK